MERTRVSHGSQWLCILLSPAALGLSMRETRFGAANTHCISTHVMMRAAKATTETTTKAVMACFFWLEATTARRSACSQRAPTYPEWQLGKKGTLAHSPGRWSCSPSAPGKAGLEEPQSLAKAQTDRSRCQNSHSHFPAQAPPAWRTRGN